MRLLFAHLIVLLLLTSLSAQTHQWAFDIPVGGTTNAQSAITAQATDDSSNVYIGGRFRGEIYLGADTFTYINGNNYAIFLAKYDKDGNYIWGQAITTAASANITKILINSSNKVLLYGSYLAGSGSITFGTQTLSRSSGVFLTFMNPNGTFSSAKDLAYGSFTAADDIALGPNDEIHALMYLSGFGVGWNIVNGSSSVAGTGFVRVVAKYNSSATSLTWQNNYSALDMNGATSIDVDRTGQVFFLASIAPNKTVLGTFSPANNTSYLVWLRPNGSYYKKLVSTSPTASFSYIGNVAVLDTNNIYIAGHAYGDSMTFAKRTIYSLTADPTKNFNFVAELKNFDSLTWARSTSHQGFGQIGTYRLAVNGDFLYLSSPQNSPTFSFAGFTNPVFTHTVVSKLDRLGNLLWYLPIQSVNAVNVNPIGTQDMVYSGEYTFSLTLAPFTLPTLSGGGRSFMARTFDYSITRGDVLSGPYCAGDTILIPYERAGDFDTANTFIAELSDENGEFFGGQRELGRLKYNKDSTILGVLPLFQVASSDKYRIRITSTSPVVQSYYRLDTLSLLIYSTDDADPGPDTSVCFGDTIQLTTFGGTTWSWSNDYNIIGADTRTPLIYPTVDTVYQIIIGDSSGCGAPDTADIKVSITPLPAFTDQSQTDTVVCKNTAVKLNTSFSGGTGTYYVRWFSNGNLVKTTTTNETVDSVTLNVRVTSNILAILTDSCSSIIDTALFNVEMYDSMQLISLPEDTLLCKGISYTTAVKAIGPLPDTIGYLWREGSVILSSDSGLNFTAVKNFSVLRVSITDKCLAYSETKVFRVNTHPELEASIDNLTNRDTFCANEEVELVALLSGGDPTFSMTPKWILDTDTFYTDTLRLSAADVLNQGGSQSFAIRLVADDECTSIKDTAAFSGFILTPVTLDSLSTFDTLLCFGTIASSSILASGVSECDYKWNVGGKALSSSQSVVFSADSFASGTSTVQAIVTDGCLVSDTAEVEVFIPEKIETIISADTSLCNGQSSLLQSNTSGGLQDDLAFSWNWNNVNIGVVDSALFAGVNHDLFVDSVVQVNLTVTDGCSSPAVDSVLLSITPKPVVSISNDSLERGQTADTTFCRGESPIFRVSTYSVNNAKVSWLLDGVMLPSSPSFTFSRDLEQQKPDYLLQVAVYDSCSMTSDTASLLITLREKLIVDQLTDTTLCNGAAIDFKARVSGGLPLGYAYQWKDGDEKIVKTTSTLSLIDLKQTQTYTLIVDDGCTNPRDSTTVTISVLDPLSVDLVISDSCTNDAITINTLTDGGLTTDYQYAWYKDGVVLPNTGVSLVAQPSSISAYKLVLSDGCSALADSAEVRIGPKPAFTIDPIGENCEPLVIAWEPKSSSSDDYTFTLIDIITSDAAELPLSEEYAAGNYRYQIIARDDLNCTDTLFTDFTVKPLPDTDFSWTPQQLDFDNPIAIFLASQNGAEYRWSLANGAVGRQKKFTYEFNAIGEYPVTLRVELNGCVDSLTQTVQFVDALRYYEVSSFTPNGDGLNEVYKPYVSGVKDLDYSIYNSYGQLVYTGSLNTPGWDGTYKGENAVEGSYMVVFSYQDNQNRRVFDKSVIYLLR